MSIPSAAETALLQTRPQRTKLWLSIYQPITLLACQVNDGSIAKGEREVTYDGVTEGSYLNLNQQGNGMTLYVGSSVGASDKGRVRVKTVSSTVITVAENSHINWEDDDYLTIVNFYEISAIYPRIIQDPGDETNTLWYKDYDQTYSSQNEDMGAFICMGSHIARFTDGSSVDIFWSASGTSHLTGDSMSYHWFFEGATVTGSTSHTPGNRTYNTPGHYTTHLIVSGTSTWNQSFRHVSIYDRPDAGTNTPILSWELVNLNGSKDQGGYKASIRIHETIPETTLRDGSLVVIFSDNWYGTTEQSIGGNVLDRQDVFFVGYVLDGTVKYNYRDSFVEFDIGSPVELMKLAEGFSVSVEDSADPDSKIGRSNAEVPSEWTLILDMDVRRALWHYLQWHSTVLHCCDFEFKGTDKAIQYFDADRTSLYDAVNTLMSGALVGRVSNDRQGKLWAETDIYTESTAYETGLAIDKLDWMGDPTLEERQLAEVSFIEAGGIDYDRTAFAPLLSAAPGSAPAYRGKVIRMQGLALTDQSHLNTLVGNIYAHKNARYPNLELSLAGNYSNFDIAPQENIPVTINANDTVRGISFSSKNFFVNGLEWRYDPARELLLPNISLHEVATGIAGDTIAIPETAPVEGDDGGGFDLPPFIIPDIPSIPPFSFGGFSDQVVVPAVMCWDYDLGDITPWSATWGAWFWSSTIKNGGWAEYVVPSGIATTTIYAIFRASTSGNIVYGALYQYGACGDVSLTTLVNTGDTTETLNSGAIKCQSSVDASAVPAGDIIRLNYYRDATSASDTAGSVYFLGWLIQHT